MKIPQVDLTARIGEEQCVTLPLDAVQTAFVEGICGSAMAGIAQILKEMGVEVKGSDAHPAPPMRTLLDLEGIEILTGYSPAHLKPCPDLVVTGNVLSRENPEGRAVREGGIPYLSFPELLEQVFFSTRRTVVTAGTHGKTTTTALAASLLEACGEDPGFLCGGIHRGFNRSARAGRGTWFVVEGDEYETSYFDKNPKFLHYPGEGVLLTSVEHDHADLYPDESAYRDLYLDYAGKLPESTLLMVYEDVPILPELRDAFRGRLLTYGQGDTADWRLAEWQPEWQRLSLGKGRDLLTFQTALFGRHNALNATGLVALLMELGFSESGLREGLHSFPGIKRRQEILFSSPKTIVADDFAHHPTAVALTIEAFREVYPGKKLVAVFEPRTNTSRTSLFQDDYVRSLSWADHVYLVRPAGLERVPEGKRFDCKGVVKDLNEHGVSSVFCGGPDSVLDLVKEAGDGPAVYLCMSNGPMEDLPARLAEHFGKNQ